MLHFGMRMLRSCLIVDMDGDNAAAADVVTADVVTADVVAAAAAAAVVADAAGTWATAAGD